jgi:hypothetical protein
MGKGFSKKEVPSGKTNDDSYLKDDYLTVAQSLHKIA